MESQDPVIFHQNIIETDSQDPTTAEREVVSDSVLAAAAWDFGSLPEYLLSDDRGDAQKLHKLRGNAGVCDVADMPAGVPVVREVARDSGGIGPLALLHPLFPDHQLRVGNEVDSLVAALRDVDEVDSEPTTTERVRVLREAWCRLDRWPHIPDVVRDLDLPAVRIMEDASRRGLRINLEDLAAFIEDLTDQQLTAREEVEQYSLGINPTKDAQLERCLREHAPWSPPADLPPPYDHELPRVAHLERLARNVPVAAAAKRYRELNVRRAQAAVLYTLRPETGRFHPIYEPGFLSRTGRMHTGGATCIGNLLKDLRRFVSADSGKVFVVADWDAFELGVMAALAGEQGILNAMSDGRDLHRETAALMLKKSAAEITDNERRAAKSVTFGVPFGRTALGVSSEIGCTVAEANRYLRDFHQAYPALAEWLQWTKEKVRAGQGFVTLPSGRVLHVGEGTPAQRDRRAVAYMVQGTAADIAKAELIEVHSALGNAGEIAIFLHDEIVVETVPERAEEVARIMKDVMEAPPDWLPNVPLRVNPEIRSTWGPERTPKPG